ncbi:unnamed protein product [Lymnaea stagnalis]|uniref:Uncharacterized protein n=1 Tax=Lymnaea stagnalis TaxID=6523 RepID=A0AAV2HEX8_LYMST
MYKAIILLLTAAVAYGQQHECPVCTDEYNYKSCTEIRTCHDSHQICMVRIDTSINNRIEYFCTNYNICELYASQGCNPSNGLACYFCCIDVEGCRGQREALFMGILAGK